MLIIYNNLLKVIQVVNSRAGLEPKESDPGVYALDSTTQYKSHFNLLY